MGNNLDDRWLASRLASLTPAWTPDETRAQSKLRTRLQPAPRARSRMWFVVAAAAVLTLTLAFGQDLWLRLFIHRIDVVQLDLDDLPLESNVSHTGASPDAVTAEEAERLAGFRLMLPAGEPLKRIATLGTFSIRQKIDAPRLQQALAKAGAHEVRVPPAWHGVELRAVIGPILALELPGEIQILEFKPVELMLPAGFPLVECLEAMLRSLGWSADQARAYGRKFAANPSLLFGVSRDDSARIEEIALASGPALLIEDFYDSVRFALIYSLPDRIVVINSPTRETCLRIAGALR